MSDAPASLHAYGSHPSQYAELYLPERRSRPGVAVIIHGGFWRQAYGAEYGRPLAADLARRGWVAWNLEYRRTAGGAGGWPETFTDVAAGIDLLHPVLREAGLDSGPVVAIGHSAGAHLGLWAAGRHLLPSGVPGALRRPCLDGVVAQSGALDLALADELNLSNGAVRELLGLDPGRDDGRWKWADPMQRLPLGVPVVAIHGDNDGDVPLSVSESYARAAAAAGDRIELLRISGDHYGVITVGNAAWELCVRALAGLAAAGGVATDTPGTGGGAAADGILEHCPKNRGEDGSC
ncbi:alpha/beta hydrolase family protein [Paeniglutamicibacter cryotolerans]|uniref:Acetyl esterase/lipase n=1 Tax=Paeniglutamicibacter cryotolerans TaxID=670079 RepID=A0A839QLU0_9MICC|nr:alpha/beta hydrolase [Paeniglutamicibacter cryotolerans]MBB2994976.1 acetyl esterase/lipase [Paeniglutamicibacter cryotolerans]